MSSNGLLLQRKRVLVVGASKGIGRAIAIALAQNGADVCVSSRTLSDIQDLVSIIKTEYKVNAIAVSADISAKTGASRIVRRAIKALGGLDALVCVAGYPFIQDIWYKKTHELDEKDLSRIFNVDVLGSFRVVKEALPAMMKLRKGAIVLFSSTAAIAGYDKGGAYAVSKAAILGLVKSIASEYAHLNIRAYAIAPGNIKTSSTFGQLSSDDQKALEKEAPMGRWGEPEEVAQVGVSLISDKMSFVTGQTVIVDGGTVMH